MSRPRKGLQDFIHIGLSTEITPRPNHRIHRHYLNILSAQKLLLAISRLHWAIVYGNWHAGRANFGRKTNQFCIDKKLHLNSHGKRIYVQKQSHRKGVGREYLTLKVPPHVDIRFRVILVSLKGPCSGLKCLWPKFRKWLRNIWKQLAIYWAGF